MLVFSHFVEPASEAQRFGGIAAHFAVATRHAHYLPLDDHEIFANNLLGVTLESMDPAPPPELVGRPRTFNRPGYASRTDSRSPASSMSSPLKFFADYRWQLPLASSLDRLFREWFSPDPDRDDDDEDDHDVNENCLTTDGERRREDQDVLSCSPVSSSSSSSSREASPPLLGTSLGRERRRSRLQPFHLSNHWPTSTKVPSAFKDATLECLLAHHERAIAPRPMYATTSRGSSSSSSSSAGSSSSIEFEYYFDSIRLDVAKVVVAAEEGLKPSEGRARGLGQTRGYVDSRQSPYVLVM